MGGIRDASTTPKLGSTIPVKFQLKDAWDCFLPGATARLFLARIENGSLGEEKEAVSTSAAVSGNLFKYDSTDHLYIFDLGTKTLSPGSWQLRIELDNETSKYAIISLR